VRNFRREDTHGYEVLQSRQVERMLLLTILIYYIESECKATHNDHLEQKTKSLYLVPVFHGSQKSR
jgi:hypothetical protein